MAAGSVELTIDGRRSSGSSSGSGNSLRGNDPSGNSGQLSSSPAKYLELSGQIYLGGIEGSRRVRALGQGVRTANMSLQGCIRRLELDGRLLGLREARVTRHVAADCQWHYPCSATIGSPTWPCLEGAQCFQVGGRPICLEIREKGKETHLFELTVMTREQFPEVKSWVYPI